VVELEGVFAEGEDVLGSWGEVFEVAPVGVEVVGAFVLAFYHHKEDGVVF
jgi:hypothetical protein